MSHQGDDRTRAPVVDLAAIRRRPSGRLNRETPERMSVDALIAEVVWLRDENDRLVRIVAEDTCRIHAIERSRRREAA